jgi:hypothetical protein
MELNGIPLHPLVVHAAVVLVPMAALASVAMVVPRWRWLTRWPALVLATGATIAVQAATLSGADLHRATGIHTALIASHEKWGERLRLAMWVLLVLTALAFWAFPYVTRLVGDRDGAGRVAALEKPLMVLLPVLAGVVLVLVVLTGVGGARSVWGGG